jgi:hypothetical protein
MKLLLDAQRHPMSSLSSSLLAKDISFSSNENPLHKAASGGRYLAVQLLLFYLIKADADRSTTRHRHTDNNLATLPTSLQQALQAKDSMGRTPLDISQQQLKTIHKTNNNHDNDQLMVASSRWDIVSGGQANWDLCSELLQLAEKDDHKYVLRLLFSDGTDSSLSLLLHKLYAESTSVKEIPALFCDGDYPLQTCSYNVASCTVGSRLSSWEQSYFETLKNGLQDSVQLLLGTNTVTTVIIPPSEEADGSTNDIFAATTASDCPSNQIDCKAAAAASSAVSNDIPVTLTMTLTSKNKKFCLGCSCHGCGTVSLTLFRGTRNKQLLYCRLCSRHY